MTDAIRIGPFWKPLLAGLSVNKITDFYLKVDFKTRSNCPDQENMHIYRGKVSVQVEKQDCFIKGLAKAIRSVD